MGDAGSIEHVTSADGTRIAYERSGEGPPLVLVHGTTSTRASWERVVPHLRERYTVYAVDRRGRGESGGAPRSSAEDGTDTSQPGGPGYRTDASASGGGSDYAIEREFEDVVAVVESIDGPTNLLGHSYGALCALGAARSSDALRRLVLYEPPLWTPGRIETPTAVVDRLHAALESGDDEAILEVFFEDVADGGDRLAIYRQQPSWEMRLAAAPTVPREIEALGEFRPEAGDLDDVTVPTLVLLGGETRDGLAGATRRAHELLPNSELHVLEGEGHAATYTAPERFVEVVDGFLDGRG